MDKWDYIKAIQIRKQLNQMLRQKSKIANWIRLTLLNNYVNMQSAILLDSILSNNFITSESDWEGGSLF